MCMYERDIFTYKQIMVELVPNEFMMMSLRWSMASVDTTVEPLMVRQYRNSASFVPARCTAKSA